MTNTDTTRTALVTGGSAGLGLALTRALAADGWRVVTDARDADRLTRAHHDSGAVTIPGDVTDREHRDALVAAVPEGLDLLVLNSSTLGPLPMRPLKDYEQTDIGGVLRSNAGGPLALLIALADRLRPDTGIVVGISSDAAVEHYPGWGLYAASKAALDQLVLTFAAETGLTGYAFDPGDMRTQMHQDAFPGEDISDRPEAATVVPTLLRLITSGAPSGRYRSADAFAGVS
jgi:NAD(P)-dependent dehydrogenase (short-subunit alcohol dehydrogenase family)